MGGSFTSVRAALTWSLTALAAFVLLTASGCGDDNNGAAGCTVDSDCRGTRVCRESQCVDADEVNNDENNDENNDTPTDCEGDLDCTPDQVCDSGACGERTGTGDPDCGGDRFCYAGLCRAAIDCQDDSDCSFFSGGYCDDGRCTPGCFIAADCPDPQTQDCAEGICRARCNADGDCDRGEICEDVCLPAECRGAGTEDCPGGQRCDTGRCVDFTPCDTTDDCGGDEICREGICEPRTSCVGDLMCPDGEQCIDGFCRESVACQVREDCPEGDDCVGGVCVPFLCRGNDDCPAGQFCDEGDCQTPDDAATVAQVIILTRAQAIAPGGEIQFQAVALDDDGNILVGQAFSWASTDDAVVDISQDGGLAVGGQSAGQVEITATAVGTNIASNPVLLTNTGAPPPAQSRVTVLGANGQPLAGAVVVRGDQTETTDESGQAFFEPANGPVNVSVFESLHNYVTIMNTTGNDILVPLEALGGGATRGGFTGQMDFSQVSSGGDINVGLAGASLNSDLTSFDLDALLGDGFNTRVNIPGLFDTTLPLPGGLVLDGVVFGFPVNIKDTYYANAEGGLKVAWGIGGKIDANEIIGLVGGGGDASNLLRVLLPFFENFDHNVEPLIVEPLAKIPDGDDLDGDGNTQELVPDYDNFPQIDVSPRVRQRLRTSLGLPALPEIGDPDGRFVIVVGGVINQGIGFVPLGLNAATDEDNDGTPEVITLRMAPPHSGLSAGRYAVIALTFDPSDLEADLTSGVDLPDNYSVVVWQGPSIPANLNIEQNFLNLPQGDWNGPGREFSSPTADGADLYRVTFIGDEGSWEVWAAEDSDGFNLPQPPDGFQDWSSDSRVRLDAFITQEGLTLDTLVEADGTNIRQISDVSEGFSRAIVNE